jgi:2-polyprenyl-3-methyl-5-hydroxy-6-metoxy-1,4-benzoquinol methylase
MNVPRIEQVLRPLVKGKRVLHVGCVGTLGKDVETSFGMHRFLHGLAAELDGIDIHEEGVECMRAAGFRVALADAETYRCAEPYDAVLVLSMLQFVASPLRVLENLGRCLVPGGVCVVSVPNVHGTNSLLRGLFRFGQGKLIQSSGQSEFGETASFASHNLVSLLGASGYAVQQLLRCHSKPAWSSASLREGFYNLRNFLPGVAIPALRPTLVCIGVKRTTDAA